MLKIAVQLVGQVYAAPILLKNLELKLKCPIGMGTAKVRIFLDPKAKEYVAKQLNMKEEERRKLKGKTVTIVIH
ncbi:hypothetical protein HYV80_00645 [Candidatus Woesearchaeota archaeon]|nr:hypothetical protein [Candidatus Woesearchaeota archaeon]